MPKEQVRPAFNSGLDWLMRRNPYIFMLHTYMCVCMYVCVCIHTYIHMCVCAHSSLDSGRGRVRGELVGRDAAGAGEAGLGLTEPDVEPRFPHARPDQIPHLIMIENRLTDLCGS